MPMTLRLYYTDAYLTEFSARVVDIAEGGRRVYLDRTAFYPTSGGQPYDKGSLNDSAVIDVVDEDDRIVHQLASPLAGEEVRGQVDWVRRFDHMQQHTGQHVLSAVFDDLFGFATVSVHFGEEYSTLDLDVAAIAPEQAQAAEAKANEIVLANRPVGVFFVDASEATGLRKAPPERHGVLRVVEVAGVDRSACGGTHVRSTAEIGPVLIRKLDKVRKNARVEFVCGNRALRRARADYDVVSAIARSLSASVDEAADLVAAQAERLAEAERQRRRMAATLQSYRAREIYDATAPAADGIRRATIRLSPSVDADDARSLAQEFSRMSRAVLVIAMDDPPGLMLATSEDSGVDAAAQLKAALEPVGGRGGGSPRVAQGRVPDRDRLEQVVAALG
jgi:alanyl-tRNA synthetase